MSAPDQSGDRAAALVALVDAVTAVDSELEVEAAAFQLRLTKPPGALGLLERLGNRLAAMSGTVPPPVPERPAVAVFAADHGVTAAGVTPWPSEVTAQMVANFCAGGAAINVLARRVGATMTVVDVGVASEVPEHAVLRVRKVRPGTGNIEIESAMSRGDVIEAILTGAETAAACLAEGADLLVGGEMGIGNTTPSAALIAAMTGRPPAEVTGRGTGIDDLMLQRKIEVIEAALARCGPTDDAIDLLAGVGGLEIAALVGFFLGGAAARKPVVVDGVIAAAAACLAVRLAPAALGFLIAGHRSSEPGASAALEWLGLEPVLDLGLRLGEGSGAALAVPVIQAAAAIMNEMATFDAAGVTDDPIA